MRKIIIGLMLFLSFGQVSFGEDIHIEVNGEEKVFEQAPLIVEDRTMVPIKFLLDTLGYKVEWLEETRQVKMNRGSNEILLTIGEHDITLNGQAYYSDVIPQIINDRTYVPVAVLAKIIGSDVLWNGETRTVSINEKLDYINVYYGSGSYNNFNEIKQDLDKVDQVSYAWAQLQIDNGQAILNTTSVNNNKMFYPTGHELVTDIEGHKLLNIYSNGPYDQVFTNTQGLIQSIKTKIASPASDEPEFDGVVLDFEGMSSENFGDYIIFVEQLREALPYISIDVALQPRDYAYEDMLPLVDHMILMLHDYESKLDVVVNLNQSYVNQETASIEDIKEDLDKILENIPTWQRDKILLQFNLAVVQWQGNTIYEVTRYTPDYEKLIERMKLIDNKDFFFKETAQLPYVHYQADGLVNTIWYENESSLQAKLKLIYDYDLGGLSLWQIGNLPSQTFSEEKETYNLRIWEKIIENSKSLD
ncbi:hypothetical protein EZV73_08375 [Acidaminobacter sp. JC074]|uniref:stalk domain-containing protein n=1 Tax=Acidaminobacter sp. JC074 TaxID=2530199 RepID=UPI001F0D3F89|nr:stalk domain-containing protein [Acidaminobacter sp. JC074]MCH4887585.1 hypothetical protein [Acidaminobacter sp. JC074]